MSLNPKPIKDTKLERYLAKAEKIHDELTVYADRAGRRWWDLERGWQRDSKARHDSEGLTEFLRTNIDYTKHPYMTPERDSLELRFTKQFIKRNKFSRQHLARIAAHLEDENWHLSANYIRYCEIGGAPESLYLKQRNLHI